MSVELQKVQIFKKILRLELPIQHSNLLIKIVIVNIFECQIGSSKRAIFLLFNFDFFNKE